jgi:UDP-N-acetylglucosamine--N-acetylmuramyl-(pentapeptide) pyrophosphoryl-undecaprenol N-acetylglucosamine transferase
MADGGAAVVIPDSELTPDRLTGAITELLDAERRLREMAVAARHLAKPDAAQRIAREVLEAAERGSMRGGSDDARARDSATREMSEEPPV